MLSSSSLPYIHWEKREVCLWRGWMVDFRMEWGHLMQCALLMTSQQYARKRERPKHSNKMSHHLCPFKPNKLERHFFSTSSCCQTDLLLSKMIKNSETKSYSQMSQKELEHVEDNICFWPTQISKSFFHVMANKNKWLILKL